MKWNIWLVQYNRYVVDSMDFGADEPDYDPCAYTTSQGPLDEFTDRNLLVWPMGTNRQPTSDQVPAQIAKDFEEAAKVLPFSAKASAALSRRCLQSLIRETAGITKRTLHDEIQELLDSGQLPSYIAGDVDAIRNIGNFAAHPNKSNNTGEIVDVEPEEAEWNLDVLEALFDFYYVQPAVAEAKRSAMNEKLADAGKQPIKRSE